MHHGISRREDMKLIKSRVVEETFTILFFIFLRLMFNSSECIMEYQEGKT